MPHLMDQGLVIISVDSTAFGFIITGYRSLTSSSAYIWLQCTSRVGQPYYCYCWVRCISSEVGRHWILSCPEQLLQTTGSTGRNMELIGSLPLSLPHSSPIWASLICMYFLQPDQECERQKVLCLLACPMSSINLPIRVSGLTATSQNLKNAHNYT